MTDTRDTRLDEVFARGEATEEELRDLESAGLITVHEGLADVAPLDDEVDVDETIRKFADGAANPQIREGLLQLVDADDAAKLEFLAATAFDLPGQPLMDCEEHMVKEIICNTFCKPVCKTIMKRVPGGQLVSVFVCHEVCKELCKEISRRVCTDV